MTPETISIEIHRLPHAPEALPQYQTPGSVGMDLQAAIEEPWILAPMERKLLPTGWILILPEGYEAQVRARSGLAIKYGISLINGMGTIDWDYREEVKVALVNLSQASYTVMPGDRIAQLVIVPVTKALLQEVSERQVAMAAGRAGGFGSTGR